MATQRIRSELLASETREDPTQIANMLGACAAAGWRRNRAGTRIQALSSCIPCFLIDSMRAVEQRRCIRGASRARRPFGQQGPTTKALACRLSQWPPALHAPAGTLPQVCASGACMPPAVVAVLRGGWQAWRRKGEGNGWRGGIDGVAAAHGGVVPCCPWRKCHWLGCYVLLMSADGPAAPLTDEKNIRARLGGPPATRWALCCARRAAAAAASICARVALSALAFKLCSCTPAAQWRAQRAPALLPQGRAAAGSQPRPGTLGTLPPTPVTAPSALAAARTLAPASRPLTSPPLTSTTRTMCSRTPRVSHGCRWN